MTDTIEVDRVLGFQDINELTIDERRQAYSQAYAVASVKYLEFENLRAKIEMLAGETVQRLTKEWDEYLHLDLYNVYLEASFEGDDPYRSLQGYSELPSRTYIAAGHGLATQEF